MSEPSCRFYESSMRTSFPNDRKAFPEGKLSVAYTNLDNGVQVRCVLDRQ